jgi:hypothetical protein
VKRDGRFSGEAFILLGTAAHIQLALDKNKSYMGRRYVEVFRAKKLVRSRARDRRPPGSGAEPQRRIGRDRAARKRAAAVSATSLLHRLSRAGARFALH